MNPHVIPGVGLSSPVGFQLTVPALPFADDALCAQVDPDLWFPEKGTTGVEARELCGRCDVQAACLAWALEHDERWGVWGGATERQRALMRKKARA